MSFAAEVSPCPTRGRASVSGRAYKKFARGSARVIRRGPPEWAVGSEVTIVYDKEKPARSALPENLAGVVRPARRH